MPIFPLSKIAGIFKAIPWQVYALAALLFAGWLYGNHRYDAGRESVLVELREAKAKAQAAARKAARSADVKERDRATAFEREQEILEKAMDNAEAADGNALDGLFGGL